MSSRIGIVIGFLGLVVAILQLIHSVWGMGLSPVQLAGIAYDSLATGTGEFIDSWRREGGSTADQIKNDSEVLGGVMDAVIEEEFDTNPPTTPRNLRIAAQDTCTVTLEWDPASDDTGVEFYAVYEDGRFPSRVEAPTTTLTNRMIPGSMITYTVIAKDAAFNESPASNDVAASC